MKHTRGPIDRAVPNLPWPLFQAPWVFLQACEAGMESVADLKLQIAALPAAEQPAAIDYAQRVLEGMYEALQLATPHALGRLALIRGLSSALLDCEFGLVQTSALPPPHSPEGPHTP
jgi:hypothetical protein